jgi:hypothetical protein
METINDSRGAQKRILSMIQLTHQRARDSGRCSGPKTEMESAHVEIPIWDGLLLKTGKVEVDSKDKDGRTLLSWAAVKGHKAVVKLCCAY